MLATGFPFGDGSPSGRGNGFTRGTGRTKGAAFISRFPACLEIWNLRFPLGEGARSNALRNNTTPKTGDSDRSGAAWRIGQKLGAAGLKLGASFTPALARRRRVRVPTSGADSRRWRPGVKGMRGVQLVPVGFI